MAAERRGMNNGKSQSQRPQRRCPRCGADLRFSHREYAGRGQQMALFRCKSCGETTRVPVPRERAEPPGAARTRKPPVDEGPPSNPVLDPETAKKLLGG